MKKCSTAALLLAASLSAPAQAERPYQFARNAPGAPDTHTVRRGDTLWDIASLFLQDPWCWPYVWESNRDQVANPHRIYPGQQIVLDRQAGRLRAIDGADANPGAVGTAHAADTSSGSRAGRPGEMRLTPSARVIAMPQSEPIPIIAPALLESAARFRLVMATAIASAPRIGAIADGRSIAGSGDSALIDGDLQAGVTYEIVRVLGSGRETSLAPDPRSGRTPFHHLTDALTLQRIGIAGDLQRRPSGPQRVRISQARSEVMTGDLLLPVPEIRKAPTSLQPAPASGGQVAALLHGGQRGSGGDVVLLDRGREAGLDVGSLVAVTKHVRIAADDAHPTSAAFARPIATLLVFDAADQVALALVLHSEDSVSAGDALGTLSAADALAASGPNRAD